VTVNYLDVTQIGNVVEANLAAFGLQSAGACPTACVTTNPELLDRFLFYVDQVHLTSAGFAIVGRYAVRQLEAPLQMQAQGDLGLSAAGDFGRLMSGRLDLAQGIAISRFPSTWSALPAATTSPGRCGPPPTITTIRVSPPAPNIGPAL
jgi:hypothetical protein